MIDIESFNKGLKTTWVKKYTDGKITENGNFFLTENSGTTAAKPFSAATLAKVTCQSMSIYPIHLLWKS